LTLGLNEIVFDSTHPGYFWPYYDLTTSGGTPGSGNTWAFSQPLLANPNWSEVAISSGDSVTVYAPSTILLGKFYAHPYANSGGGSLAPGVVIRDCTIGNSANSSMSTNNGVEFIEDALGSNLQSVPGSNSIMALVNVSAPTAAVDMGDMGGGFGGQQNYVIGGIYGIPSAGSQDTLTCSGCQIDGDLIFGQSPGIMAGSITNFAGQVYVDVGEGIITYPGAALVFNQALFSSNVPVLWGGGSLTIGAQSTVNFQAGAGKAVGTFAQKSGIVMTSGGGTPPACYLNTTTGAQTCNLPVTPTQLDTTLGATTGCFYVPGGASICN
jgi:hypothetical protein